MLLKMSRKKSFSNLIFIQETEAALFHFEKKVLSKYVISLKKLRILLFYKRGPNLNFIYRIIFVSLQERLPQFYFLAAFWASVVTLLYFILISRRDFCCSCSVLKRISSLRHFHVMENSNVHILGFVSIVILIGCFKTFFESVSNVFHMGFIFCLGFTGLFHASDRSTQFSFQ